MTAEMQNSGDMILKCLKHLQHVFYHVWEFLRFVMMFLNSIKHCGSCFKVKKLNVTYNKNSRPLS